MKKNINIYIMIIAALAILLTATLCTMAYYRVFRQEVMTDLKVYTELLADASFTGDEETAKVYAKELSNEHIRMTLIDESGKVLFDNVAEVEALDNHSDRIEIEKALEYGTGSSVRKSNTINKTNFYYAIRLPDGGVVRTARETSSIYYMFANEIPIVAAIAFLLLVVCFVISNFLTRSILAPIKNMAYNMEELENIKTYKELEPVISHIKEQHQNILKNANMRQEFTANISHELKTPLTSVSGYAELIENGMTNEQDTRKFAGEIHKNANRLLTLINDILRLSELDTTEYGEFEVENVDLYESVLNCIAMLEPAAEKHHVTLKASGKRTMIQANKDMIEELVYNLCDNAIHYNKPGGFVSIHVEDNRLTVEDSGIGISNENLSRIFERFYRVDKSRSKKTGGTGLGLAIVKHIVEIHGAKLAIESQPDVGTMISVKF